jgi:hypothetical protein
VSGEHPPAATNVFQLHPPPVWQAHASKTPPGNRRRMNWRAALVPSEQLTRRAHPELVIFRKKPFDHCFSAVHLALRERSKPGNYFPTRSGK